jgi:hypothetical protein
MLTDLSSLQCVSNITTTQYFQPQSPHYASYILMHNIQMQIQRNTSGIVCVATLVFTRAVESELGSQKEF